MAETGSCNLCGLRKLLCKAHILPEWCYDELRGGVDIPKIYPSQRTGYPKRSPKGLYDEGILCSRCDHSLGDLDNYGRGFFRGPFVPDERSLKAGYYDLAHVDYANLKLFILSALWRAHISTLPEFAAIDLGSSVANKMRAMLRASDPEGPNVFSVIISRYYVSDPANSDLLFALPVPVKSNHAQLEFFRIRILEYCIIINVGDVAFPSEWSEFVLSPKKNLTIRLRDYMRSRDFEDARQINDIWE